MARRDPRPAVSLTWAQVGAWRMQRQYLTALDGPPEAAGAVVIAERLLGVQAQVASQAALAVALRQQAPGPQDTATALENRTLVKTWAARGTLHLHPPEQAASVLALLANAKTWHKGVWQKNFLTIGQMDALATAVTTALADGTARTCTELMDRVIAATGDDTLAEHLGSGWGQVLKPLAWQGLLCHGPSDGQRITFVRPDLHVAGWPGLPSPDDAARTVIPAWLGTYGPGGPAGFDLWLIRNATPKAQLKRWFADLEAAGEVVAVDVEGERLLARSQDVDELAGLDPAGSGGPVRLLPAFDQFILGPGTGDPHVLDPAQRPRVSRAAGWISPLVVRDGRVIGVWEPDGAKHPQVTLFPGEKVPAKLLKAEVERVSGIVSVAN